MLDRDHLGLMDMRAERNAFGRQLQSFEADLEVRGIAGGPLRAVFIRAPWIAEHGPGVEILAEVDGHPVAAREGNMLAVAFHAELTDDERLHRSFPGGQSARPTAAVKPHDAVGLALHDPALAPAAGRRGRAPPRASGRPG